MRLSPEILSNLSSWPYHPTEPYISPSVKGDMAEEKIINSVMQFPKNGDKEAEPFPQHGIKSPNVSNDSGIDGDIAAAKNNGVIPETNNPLSSLRNWSNGDIGPIGLESDEPSYPNSPNSPKKLTQDLVHDSPTDQASLTEFPLEIVCNKNGEGQSVNSLQCTCIEECNERLASEDTNAIPSIFLSCAIGENHNRDSRSPFEVLPDLETLNQHECGETIVETKEPSCSNWGSARPKSNQVIHVEEERSCDDYSDDGTLSVYYVPSIASTATNGYSQSPVAPPRSARIGRLRREQTQSEADASSASSSSKSVLFKSLRSKSDPSTHYTTVIKPTPIRPALISIHPIENGSLESLQTPPPAPFMQPGRDQRSAFREHLRNNLGHGNDGALLFFSRSLEASLPTANEESVFLETGESTSSLSPTRRYSFNDASNDRTSGFQSRETFGLVTENVLQQSEQNGHQPSQSSPNLGIAEDQIRKRHTLPSELNGHLPTSCSMSPLLPSQNCSEPIHMTLEEVRSTLQATATTNATDNQDQSPEDEKKSPCRQFFRVYFRPRKSKKGSKQNHSRSDTDKTFYHHLHHHHHRSFPSSMKAAISSWFRLRRNSSTSTPKKEAKPEENPKSQDASLEEEEEEEALVVADELAKSSVNTSPFTNRALPPLPVDGSFLWEPSVRVIDDETSSLSASSVSSESDNNHSRTRKMDYAASIEKVKDCGWYWGPISGETAEKLLLNEPDGSFVVRDSSDEHYIFSLTFKLNGFVRHVRIEHDHGNFSFGCQQKFRSNTIVDFIENAVEHSRSGRYLFFLHRRPVLGPMRVQLLHPVSRFKQVQSLQHLCRFVILKSVRRDLIDSLPLPRCLRDYLNTPHYYSEELAHLSLVAAVAAAAAATSVAASSQNSSATPPPS